MIGKTLGHYQITEKLGKGGMGVVYKARDTHLDRFVAIKTLPPERIADTERKRRFVQEAKAASALNHPNIITIHDIDQAEGVDFIAMEYVVGKTLDDLIPHKGMRLSLALKYAIQIADALARAHGAGIIHRDLKPSNVMVDEHGLVKVLDFGLAKLTEAAGPDTETISTGTADGTIVGTAAFMSPEQAEGKQVDGRSDIYSFGSVLYEMLTGQRAFRGDTRAATIAAILREKPKPIGQVAEGLPWDLEKLVHRCLQKDMDRRYQHMGDVKIALEELKEESESGKLGAADARVRHLRWGLWAAMMAGALILVSAVAILIRSLTRAPEQAPAPVLTRLTSDTGLTTDPALSPDGKFLAYASDRSGDGNLDIWIRQVGGGEPMRLTRDTADEHEPAFSPDGTKIAFRSEREGGGIYVVSTLGGTAKRIVQEGGHPRFSPDGNWIAYSSGPVVSGVAFDQPNSLKTYVVASGGGVPKRVQPEFANAVYPIWSPDGKHLLFLGNRDEKLVAEGNVDWWIAPVGGGPPLKTGILETTLRAGLYGPLQGVPSALLAPTWTPDGQSLVFSARSGDSTNLWRIGLSTKTWKTTGPPQRLTSGPTLEVNPSAAPAPSQMIRVAFASLSENLDVFCLPLEVNQGKVVGGPQRLTQDSAADFFPALSRDGSKLAFISGRTGSQEIWIKDLRSGAESALTSSRWNKWRPRFSPDDSKVSFSSIENRKWNIYIMPAAGGAPEMICEDCGQASDWSSDGRFIIGNSQYGRLWLWESESRRTMQLSAPAVKWLAFTRFSSDQHWIGLFSEPAWRSYVAPFQRGAQIEEKSLIEIAESGEPQLSPDCSVAYFWSSRDGYGCYWGQRLDRITKRPIGPPFAVFHSHNARYSLSHPSFVASDKLVFDMGERTGNIWMAEFKP